MKYLNKKRKITNIVFMGMGEPLYNYDEVKKAIQIFLDNEGLNFSRRKITLSTSGVVPKIEKLKNDLDVSLAISLHAVSNEVRNNLVPINRKWPIEKLLEVLTNYPGVNNSRRITFEYVMLEGINDTINDAKVLIKLLKSIPAKVNLIPFNPWPGSTYKCSSIEVINKLPDKVDTIVGERGMKLSGGQRQRISLARAIVSKPEILILDEATSSLDEESEELIFDALKNISKFTTIILISHDNKIINLADKIYYIEEGNIKD